MSFDQEKVDEAITDFVKGKGKGKPSAEHCLLLMKHYVPIRKLLRGAYAKNLAAVSIIPSWYDDSSVWLIENPVFIGIDSTEMFMGPEEKRMKVYFDRD